MATFWGAAFAFSILTAIGAVGFINGYRGEFRKTAWACGIITSIFLVPQTIGSLLFPPMFNTKMGMDVLLPWLITFGSLIGGLMGRKVAILRTVSIHLGIAACSWAVTIGTLEILQRIVRR